MPTPPDFNQLVLIAPEPAFAKMSGLSLVATNESLALTPEETEELTGYQRALFILGPAAGAVMMCPGNQDNLDDQDKCPYSAKCPLIRMKKAPTDHLCPLEKDIMETRFNAWCKEMVRDPLTMLESDRAAVSDLTWIDIQIQRCQHILSKGEEARLTVVNPKDVHPETLLPVSWEKVIHPNVERLDQLVTSRRMILKDWMMTPEQKWKVARAEGKASGKDISSQQSGKADKLRKLGQLIDG